MTKWSSRDAIIRRSHAAIISNVRGEDRQDEKRRRGKKGVKNVSCPDELDLQSPPTRIMHKKRKGVRKREKASQKGKRRHKERKASQGHFH